MENQCFVAIAPTVGDAPQIATLDENHGCAGVYGPVDRGFAPDGVVVEGEMDVSEWLIVDLNPTRLAAVRADGAVRNHQDHPLIPPPCKLANFA
jgi:predicted amidohydrolase